MVLSFFNHYNVAPAVVALCVLYWSLDSLYDSFFRGVDFVFRDHFVAGRCIPTFRFGRFHQDAYAVVSPAHI